jgi:hypothetical protein
MVRHVPAAHRAAVQQCSTTTLACSPGINANEDRVSVIDAAKSPTQDPNRRSSGYELIFYTTSSLRCAIYDADYVWNLTVCIGLKCSLLIAGILKDSEICSEVGNIGDTRRLEE